MGEGIRSKVGMKELRSIVMPAIPIEIPQVMRVPTALSMRIPARIPRPMQKRESGEA